MNHLQMWHFLLQLKLNHNLSLNPGLCIAVAQHGTTVITGSIYRCDPVAVCLHSPNLRLFTDMIHAVLWSRSRPFWPELEPWKKRQLRLQLWLQLYSSNSRSDPMFKGAVSRDFWPLFFINRTRVAEPEPPFLSLSRHEVVAPAPANSP